MNPSCRFQKLLILSEQVKRHRWCTWILNNWEKENPDWDTWEGPIDDVSPEQLMELEGIKELVEKFGVTFFTGEP